MENILEIFVAGVNRIRSIKGLTQEQLANKIPGGKRGTVSSWLRGRTRFPKERMADFSTALNIPVEEIIKVGREEQAKRGQNSNQIINETMADSMAFKDDNNIFQLNNSLEAEYLSIIRQFKNKHMVCSITRKLVELEALDDTALAEIIVEIKNKIEKAQVAKKRTTANGTD